MLYKLGLTNIIIIVISLLLFVSPLSKKPGPIHPLLVVPFFYCMFSFIPSGIFAFWGLGRLFKGQKEIKFIAVVIINLAFLILFFLFVRYSWQGWMSI